MDKIFLPLTVVGLGIFSLAGDYTFLKSSKKEIQTLARAIKSLFAIATFVLIIVLFNAKNVVVIATVFAFVLFNLMAMLKKSNTAAKISSSLPFFCIVAMAVFSKNPPSVSSPPRQVQRTAASQQPFLAAGAMRPQQLPAAPPQAPPYPAAPPQAPPYPAAPPQAPAAPLRAPPFPAAPRYSPPRASPAPAAPPLKRKIHRLDPSNNVLSDSALHDMDSPRPLNVPKPKLTSLFNKLGKKQVI